MFFDGVMVSDNVSRHQVRASDVSISKAPDRELGCTTLFDRFDFAVSKSVVSVKCSTPLFVIDHDAAEVPRLWNNHGFVSIEYRRVVQFGGKGCR